MSMFDDLSPEDKLLFEDLLAETLDELIWEEITANTGETKAMLDQKIIDEIRKLASEDDKKE